MALGTTDITPRTANSEMGSPHGILPTDLTVKEVCGYAFQNQYSFYGSWNVKPNTTTKCIEIDYGTSDYRLGDFRLYNHSANASNAVFATMNLGYYPSTSTLVTVIPINMSEMNVLAALSAYSSSTLYLCHRLYYTSSARTAESGYFQTITSILSWYTPTIASNHIRTPTERASSTQIHDVSIDTSGMSGTDYIYADSYISNASGTRLLTLGSSKSAGYTDITMTPYTVPYMAGKFTLVSGSGLTGTRVALWSDTTKCSEGQVTQSVGTAWSFYIKIIGAGTGGQFLIAANDITIQLKHYNHLGSLLETKTIVTTFDLWNTQGRSMTSGTYGVLANGMSNGHRVDVHLTALSSWGAVSGTACP